MNDTLTLQPKYDLAVIIGRFQPFHNGHLSLFEEASKLAKNTLVLVGSSYIARNIKNPFTFEERVEMISAACGDQILFRPIIDDLYNDQQWIATVQENISDCLENLLGICNGGKVCIIGHHKDDSSYYLDCFPKYDFHEASNVDVLHSTEIRNILFGSKMVPSYVMPEKVMHHLKKWSNENSQVYDNLCEEYAFVKKYKEMWVNSPFPVIFSTTDAVIICQGHLLLVKRKMAPGKGLWALPGGFLGINESIEDSMIREVSEETRIKVPVDVLRSSIKGNKVFDHPNRSLRGRTITHAYLVVLQNRELPKVRGSDDAEKAKWVPISEFYNMTDQMFEDHYSIASFLINRAG